MANLIEIASKRCYGVVGKTTIGRAEGCEIRIDDPLVSATHAEILEVDGHFQIRDLDSRRGTFVGAKRIKQVELRDGDELMIGLMRLRFQEEVRQPADSDELPRLRAVVELVHAIGVEHDVGRVLARILETAIPQLRADRGSIMLYEPESQVPNLTVTRTRTGDCAEVAISQSVLTQVMANHQPYLRTEIDSDVVLQRSASLHANGVRSVMAVPLRYGADWLGVVQIDSRAIARVFGPRDLELLAALAGPAALAIKNAMLVRALKSA